MKENPIKFKERQKSRGVSKVMLLPKGEKAQKIGECQR